MLSKNIFIQQKFKLVIIKFIYIISIIVFLQCIFLGTMTTAVQATQLTEKYTVDSLKDYPGYETLIEALKKAHPTWNFTILYTGLDWNQVIKNETTVVHGRNLIDGAKTGEWVCPTCGSDRYDNGSWKCASEATVAYYMDPRNSLFEDYIFQFEDLKWVEGVYTIDGINKILADCKYLQGTNITYTAVDGTTKTIEKSYAQIILEAGQENNVSPYHLAARIRQEQGPGNSASATATGTYGDYKGLYNFFNVNASGSGSSTIIKNALTYARTNEWTDPEKSIKGGAKFVADEYITTGQSTLYLQKFDVDNSDGSLYWHQYMQNVAASKTEGGTILKTYKSINTKLDQAFNFIIPVYKNMPDIRCPQPGSQTIVTQNIEITNDTVVVREEKSLQAKEIATLKKGDNVLRIEMGNTKTNEYLWDKVVLEDGTKGYIVSEGFKIVEDSTNCNIRAIAIEYGNVRNGPGTSGTTVLTTLTIGQNVTIIEKDKYKNINGEDWTRIYLSDGRQGYIVGRYLEEVDIADGSLDSGEEIVKVICTGGLSVRGEPGIDSRILKYADKGDYLTRIEKEVSTKDNYIWDKIITDDGIEGYVARGDKDGDYIQVVTQTTNIVLEGEEFKTTGTNVVCGPKTTIEDLKKVTTDVVVKNSSGKEVTTGNIGTGYTIKCSGQTYTVIKRGDTNGDAKLTPADSTVVLRSYVGTAKLSEAEKLAADTNGDGKLTPADSTVILRTYVGLTDIKI